MKHEDGAKVKLCSHDGCSNQAIGAVCRRHGAKVKLPTGGIQSTAGFLRYFLNGLRRLSTKRLKLQGQGQGATKAGVPYMDKFRG